jgi:hypothetical protein
VPPTLRDFRDAVTELNRTFPRPDLALIVSDCYDVRTEYATQFPASDNPGVYALIAADGIEVLRIGTAQTLGSRLGSYLAWDDRKAGSGRAKDPDYSEVRYLVTVSVPVNRAFEALSIEAFLLLRFQASPPRLNRRLGRKPLDDYDCVVSGKMDGGAL